MTYKFVDVDEANFKSYMSIQTIINDFNLDTDLDGYKTLNVSGRSVFGRDIETLKFSSRRSAGSKSTRNNVSRYGANKFLNSVPQGLVIEVEFILQAQTNEIFRKQLSKLISILHQEEAKWSWTDDPFYFYTGTISEVGTFKEDKNSIKSDFKILCIDPMKTSKQAYTLKAIGKSIKIPRTMDMIDLESMNFVFRNEAKSFVFENEYGQGRSIIYGDFKVGDRLKIDLKKNVIYLNELNYMTGLDLDSDIEEFYVDADSTIELSTMCDCEISYRLRSC